MTPEEKAVTEQLYDALSSSPPRHVIALTISMNILRSLYAKQLIYYEVPISNDDHIAVPPLEGFVMNRVSGDYFENLLYKIFVSTDERLSVEKLAEVLDIDVENVKVSKVTFLPQSFPQRF
jgi:hypothetical protein